MKKIKQLFCINCINLISIAFILNTCSIAAQAANNKQVTIYMIGNSTMANKPLLKGNPEKGWGQVFPLYFTSDVRIKNYAVNGRSTKSFIDEGRWEEVKKLIEPGDYLIIEFGHNDSKVSDPKRFADAKTDYKHNLELFINEARLKGGIPVLATPVNRRKFDSLGIWVDTHGDYPIVMRSIAEQMKVALIDLHKKSEELLKRYGVEESKKLYLWISKTEYDSLSLEKQDDTHFSATGAFRICDLVIEEIRVVLPELVKYFKD